MTVILWALFAVLAVLDWVALARGLRPLEIVAKPGAMVALLGVVAASGASDRTAGVLLVVALVLCLAGDVLLLSESEGRFLAGLSAFLLGHLAYAVLFVHLGLTSPWWAAAAVVVVGCLLPVAIRIARAATAAGGAVLGGGLTAYIVVISAMAVLGAATGHGWLAVGAFVFVVSDTILGFNRFVRPLVWGPVGVMVTYLVAQGLLVLGALGAINGQ